MANITNCPVCGIAYEEWSEEDANSPDRRCTTCTLDRKLWLVDESGERTNFGSLIRKRTIEHLDLALTFDEAKSIWWIVVVADKRTITLGYKLPRREDAWDLFINGTVAEIIAACRPEAQA